MTFFDKLVGLLAVVVAVGLLGFVGWVVWHVFGETGMTKVGGQVRGEMLTSELLLSSIRQNPFR